MNIYKAELSSLESLLEQLELDSLRIYDRAEKGMTLCSDSLERMRKRVLTKGFRNIEEECLFFKTIKPRVVGYLIHFVNLVAIERERPQVTKKAKYNFYLKQIALYKEYFVEQSEMYEYYIRELSDRDIAYFTRNSAISTWYCASITSIIDPSFSSSKDMVLAKILGYTLTINYLQHKFSQKKRNFSGEKTFASTLKWTGAKVDLVELIYALHSSAMINNGQAGLNELAQSLEKLFGVDLGDIYRIYREIRGRKNVPTRLLDNLKKNLLNKMIEADG